VQPGEVPAASSPPGAVIESVAPTEPVVQVSRVSSPASPAADATAPLPGDWSQLFPGLAGTFAGAFLALWMTVWLDRATRRRNTANEQTASADRLRGTLDLIDRELAWNHHEVKAISVDLDSQLRTDRAPMTDAWNAVGPEAMKVGGVTATSMSEAYALLSRCRRLLEQYAGDLAQGPAGLRIAREQTLPRLRELVVETSAAVESARRQMGERPGVSV
jgi:hypothetical protein